MIGLIPIFFQYKPVFVQTKDKKVYLFKFLLDNFLEFQGPHVSNITQCYLKENVTTQKVYKFYVWL